MIGSLLEKTYTQNIFGLPVLNKWKDTEYRAWIRDRFGENEITINQHTSHENLNQGINTTPDGKNFLKIGSLLKIRFIVHLL